MKRLVSIALSGAPAARREIPSKTVVFVTAKQPTSIAIGWSEPVSGRGCIGLSPAGFPRRTLSPTTSNYGLELAEFWVVVAAPDNKLRACALISS
jgi:hypothetical protein